MDHQGSPCPATSSSPGGLPPYPSFREKKEEGFGAAVGWLRGGLVLAEADLYYLMAPSAKYPETLEARFEPMSAAGEKAIPLGFLKARAPGSRQAAREHLPVSDVSSQVTLIPDCPRI